MSKGIATNRDPGQHFFNKKFKLMLTRCAKAYSSSCSKTVSLSPAISLQFILEVCSVHCSRK